MEGDNDIPTKEWGMRKTVTFSAEKTITIIKYTFSIVGLVLIIVTIFLFISTSQFVEKSATASGTVITFEESTIDYRSAYHPIVEFKIADKGTFQFKSSSGSNPPSYRIGEQVEVLYDPTSPRNARIKSFLSLWFPVVITAALGFVFTAIGLWMNLYFRSRKLASKKSRESDAGWSI